MTTLIRFIMILIALLQFAGCSTAPSWSTSNNRIDPLLESSAQAPTLLNPLESLQILQEKSGPNIYRVGPNDEILVTVWGNTDLWSEHIVHSNIPQHSTLVQQDGTVSLPLLGTVRVSGLTVAEITLNLKNLYSKMIESSFQIEVSIHKALSQRITLEGAFKNTGIAYIGPNQQTLGQIISAAGGFTEDADTANGILTRGQNRYAINFRESQAGGGGLHNLIMQQGDVLFFPSQSERVYYIFGEVVRQGAYPIPPNGISMLEGIAKAWGPNMVTGNMGKIFLIRASTKEQKPSIYKLSMDEIMAHEDVALLPGDRIFIPPTGLANWSRTINQLFGGTSSATQTLQTFTIP